MKPILVCGLEHVIAKTARHYRMLGDMLQTNVVMYTADGSGLSSEFARRFGITWHKAPSGKRAADIAQFASLLRELRPAHVELYLAAQSDIVRLGYILVARRLSIPIVVVCRGGELLYWHLYSDRRRFVIRLSLRWAHMVLYKQLHMPPMLERLRVPEDRTFFFHNRIPIDPREPSPAAARSGVLFLNVWQWFRHPEVAVEVGLRLAQRFPGVKFTVAGDRYFTEASSSRPELDQAIRAAGLAERIRLMGWVASPEELFAQHNIFLLPADLVFLNYTLLEAMERALSPVIAKAEGSDRIIEHGKDGLIVDLNADAFAEAVEYLLLHPPDLERMAGAARSKVQRCFNLEDGLRELIGVYRSKVWQ
jgi:glycosyltransferase involved in cell wall biosynthesis